MDAKTLREFFNQEEEWEKPIRQADQERAWKIIGMIPKDASAILEVGCGNGIIINKIGPPRFVVGVDFSHAALQFVRKVRVMGDCANLPFCDSSFDMVIAAELLEHLDDDALNKTLTELQRVTREYLLISVPFEERPFETFVKCADCGLPYSPYGHQQYFDERRVKNLIKARQQTVELLGAKKALPWLKWLMQRFLGHYSYRDYSICPRCGSNQLVQARLARFYGMVQATLARFLARTKPATVLCLYRLS